MTFAFYRPSFHGLARCVQFMVLLCLGLGSGAVYASEFSHISGMKFVNIPAGDFLMGSCQVSGPGQKTALNGCIGPDLDTLLNEIPQHQVSVAAFQMSKTEVTLGQFKRYIIDTGLNDLVTDDFMKFNPYSDDAPVVHVSWNEAKNFIAWLNKNKAASDHGTYRLPSEAEWEYACRGGATQLFCGSITPSAVAWHSGNSGKHQQAVGRKNANPFGLYDMSGNVWEWVEDCYHENYRDAPINGSAWTTPCSSAGRVLRSGSWKGDVKNVRAATRVAATAVSRSNNIGFRVVRVLP